MTLFSFLTLVCFYAVWPFYPLFGLFSCDGQWLVSKCFTQANHSILLYGLVDMLILFGTLDIRCHKSIQTPHLLDDCKIVWFASHRSKLPLSLCECVFFFHSCILLNFQQQYAKAYIKRRMREKIKRNKNGYEIVANEIILTFKCVYTKDKLFSLTTSQSSVVVNANPDNVEKNIHRACDVSELGQGEESTRKKERERKIALE